MACRHGFAVILAAVWLPTGGSSFGAEPAKSEAAKEYDFVQTATAGTFRDGILTLSGVGETTIYFAERPNRDVGEIPHPQFFQSWASGAESLAADPPNASLVTNDGKIAILELSEPDLAGEAIRYHAKLIGGDLPDSIGPASLFIDAGGLMQVVAYGAQDKTGDATEAQGAIVKFKQYKGNPTPGH